MKAIEKKIEFSVDAVECMAFHDFRWTQEALINLLDNAIKYSPSGTTVEIRLQKLTSYALIEVIDQGMGVEKGAAQDFPAFLPRRAGKGTAKGWSRYWIIFSKRNHRTAAWHHHGKRKSLPPGLLLPGDASLIYYKTVRFLLVSCKNSIVQY